MLVLSSKVGQKILVGDVEITVVKVRGRRARIGISAPSNVSIRRAEVFRNSKFAPRSPLVPAAPE